MIVKRTHEEMNGIIDSLGGNHSTLDEGSLNSFYTHNENLTLLVFNRAILSYKASSIDDIERIKGIEIGIKTDSINDEDASFIRGMIDNMLNENPAQGKDMFDVLRVYKALNTTDIRNI